MPNSQPRYKSVYQKAYRADNEILPIVNLDFENTRRKALKNTQYSMAKMIKIETQKSASNTKRSTIKSIAIAIHNTNEIIMPLIPSSVAIAGISKLGNSEGIPKYSPDLYALNFGKLSFKPIPK